MISKIKTLKQLHLMADPPNLQCYLKWHWIINHDTMRAHLSRLPHIQRITSTGDTYELEGEVPDSFFEAEGIEPPEDNPKNRSLWRRFITASVQEARRRSTSMLSRLWNGSSWDSFVGKFVEVTLRKRPELWTRWNPRDEVVNLFLCRRSDGRA
jgi:hypothetical protein